MVHLRAHVFRKIDVGIVVVAGMVQPATADMATAGASGLTDT